TLQVTGDFNGDGKSDLLWQDSAGDTFIWYMNGASVLGPASVGNVAGWTVQGVNAN
ncbi:MAG: FG-GAP repeat protein, partial [Xanthobacteraceae bacterium]|nr:FG-GAP repeat protein [Xanthobacteraceae bacterium]